MTPPTDSRYRGHVFSIVERRLGPVRVGMPLAQFMTIDGARTFRVAEDEVLSNKEESWETGTADSLPGVEAQFIEDVEQPE